MCKQLERAGWDGWNISWLTNFTKFYQPTLPAKILWCSAKIKSLGKHEPHLIPGLDAETFTRSKINCILIILPLHFNILPTLLLYSNSSRSCDGEPSLLTPWLHWSIWSIINTVHLPLSCTCIMIQSNMQTKTVKVLSWNKPSFID